MGKLKLTTSPDEFSIDGYPVEVGKVLLDGNNNNPKAGFKHPITGETTHEKAAKIKGYTFNGSPILTPSAIDKTSSLGVNNLVTYQLIGNFSVLDLQPGVQYDKNKMEDLLHSFTGEYTDNILLFRTKLMDELLNNCVNNEGELNWDKYTNIYKKQHPSITPEGAYVFTNSELGRGTKAILIDGLSFESPEGGNKDGFKASQILMNNSESNFRPLVYHLSNTTNQIIDGIADNSYDAIVNIQTGPLLKKHNLPQMPVDVIIEYENLYDISGLLSG